MKDLITYEQFSSIDIRVGLIKKCERKEGADKLLRLTVDFGEEGERTILSSLYPLYEPEDLQDKKFIFITNLEPRKFMGELSHGMILCADDDKPIPLVPQTDTAVGSKIT